MPRNTNKEQKRQMMAVMICLLFLFSTIAGALLANGLSLEQRETLQRSINILFQTEQQNTPTVWSVFLKYLKYDVLIWLGGCFYYGAVLSAGILAFRGISLGYTAAVLFMTYQAKGIFAIICAILPQNLILLPIYFFMTWLAFCFWMEQKKGQSGKGALKREVTRIWTEYAILLWGSILIIAIASFVEVHLSSHFINMLGVFLK